MIRPIRQTFSSVSKTLSHEDSRHGQNAFTTYFVGKIISLNKEYFATEYPT